MRHGNLYVISGPSGVGKGTLMALLCERLADVWVSVSWTTRKPRPNDVDGIDYCFVSEEEFLAQIESGGFLEWACYEDHLYGTPLSPVAQHIADGFQVILEIDTQGARKIRALHPEALYIFIEPPSLIELERRLRNRDTEDENAISARLAAARLELSHKMEYDIRLVNDDVQKTAARLVAIVNERAETFQG